MKLLVLCLCQSTSPSHGKRLTLEQCAQLKKGLTLPQLSILTSIAKDYTVQVSWSPATSGNFF